MHHASQAEVSSSLQQDALGCIWSALEENPESLLLFTQIYIQLKAMGRTDMEDHHTSHHYMYFFCIVATLFPMMEAIKYAHLLHNLDFNRGAVSNLIILHF